MEKIHVAIIIALLVSGCGTGLRNPHQAQKIGHPHQITTDGNVSVGNADSSTIVKDADSTDSATDVENPIVDAGSDSEMSIKEAGTSQDALIGTDAGTDSTVASNDSGSQCDSQIQDANQDSGDAGQDASQDAGQVPVCTPQDLRCLGQNIQICTNQGQWLTDFTCQYACTGAGNCVGNCVPGSTTCSGNTPKTCDTSGTWVKGTACLNACLNGTCVCNSGDKRCSGNVSQTCNSSGQWVTNQTCPYVCSGTGNCTGSCVPTTKDCSGNTPRTCDSNGSWVNGTACSYVCSGAGVCSGVCTPGSNQCSGLNSQTCNSSGQWVTNQTCSYVCSGTGTCSGSCVPNSKQCSGVVPQTCDSSGAWVSGASCPFVCSSGACSGVCTPGASQCSGQQIQTCNGNGQWATAVNCGAVTNATSYCSGGSCKFNCNLDYDDCDGVASNGCEVNVNTDGNNCGTCGHSCCGGACGSGVCRVYDTGIYSSIYDVDKDNIYWTPSGSNINQQPRTGGTPTTIITQSATNNYTVWVNDIRSNGDTLFWSNIEEDPTGLKVGGDIFSVSIIGNSNYSQSYTDVNGSLFTISSTHGAWTWDAFGTGKLALDYTRVFWGDVSTPTLMWQNFNNLNETSQSISVSGTDGPSSFISDNNYVYTAKNSKAPLARYLLTDSKHTETDFITSTSTNYSFGLLAIDSINLYYIFYDGTNLNTSGVWKKSLNNNETAVQLASESSGNYIRREIATDGTNVYYASGNATSTTLAIYKVSINGGTPKLVTSLNGNNITISNLKVIDQCIYWYKSQPGTVQTVAVSP